MVAAGTLRHRMRFEAADLTVDDGQGGASGGWHTHCTVWAAVERRAGSVERMIAGGLAPQPVVRIIVHFSPETVAIQPGMRAVQEDGIGPPMRVVSVQDTDGRRRTLTITAVEGGPV